MSGKLVTLATFDNPIPAHLARSTLESHGISVYLADEETYAMDWLLGNAIGWIKLQVMEDDAEQAAGILESLRKDEQPAEPEESLSEGRTCSVCGQSFSPDCNHCPYCGLPEEDEATDLPPETHITTGDVVAEEEESEATWKAYRKVFLVLLLLPVLAVPIGAAIRVIFLGLAWLLR